MTDSNWFPQPPPKPLKAPSAAWLVFGFVAAVAVSGAIVWTLAAGRTEHTAKATTTAPVAATAGTPLGTRQAFAECMKNMGAGSGFRGRGRFGGGPPKGFRTAVEVCRSLIRPGQVAPAAPQRTGTTPAPVA